MGRKLFVGNLSFETTSDELKEFFAQAGMCESAVVMSDRMTGRPRGFGFVEMGTDNEAQRAVAELNGRELKGRALNVSEAREKTPGVGGGGAGYSWNPGPPPEPGKFRKDGGSRRGLRARKRSL